MQKSRFKRGDKKPNQDKPWSNPSYDGLRPDKKKISPPNEEEKFEATCHVARAMKKSFQWREWMGNFINEDGSNKPYQGGII